MSRFIAVVAAFVVTFALCQRASATPSQPHDDGAATTPTSKHGSAVDDVHVSGGPGFSRDNVLGGALVHSLTAGYRYGYFEPALVADLGARPFGGTYAAVGVSLGAVLQTDAGYRFSLRGVIGSDSYMGVDCNMFCRRGGAAATLPYAGARLGASYVFWSRGRSHLELGLEGFYGADLEKRRVRYTKTGGLLSDSTSSGERVLGGERLGAVVTVGWTFDASPISAAPRRSVASR